MTVYELSVESGPRRRKTMVHVLDLLGCVVRGATTEEALAAAPGAIRDYLAFLRRHREPGLPPAREAVETRVVTHVDQGTWLGEGDPDAGFAPDFEPLTPEEQQRFALRLGWMQREFFELLSAVPARELAAKPAAGRSLRAILGHVAGAQYGYLQAPLSKPAGLAAAVRAVEEGPDPLGAFERCCALARERLDAATEEERAAVVRLGAKQWTARRAVRRMLEHQWEHLAEVRGRLAPTS